MKNIIIFLMALATVLCAADKHPKLRENLKCITDSSGNGKHIDPDYVYNANRVVLYFGASWCGYCKQFYNEKLLPYYDSLGAVVLYVSLDDNKNTTYKYMRKSKMPWNVVMPGTGCVDNMKRLYKTTGGIPELVALDSTDRIISKGNAFDSFEKLKSEITKSRINSVAIDSIITQMHNAGIPDSLINELINRSK